MITSKPPSAVFLLVPLYRQQSRIDETLEMATKVLPVFERELGPEHPRTLRCVWYIAGSYNQLNMVEEATVHYRRLISTYEETLGPNHGRVGMLRSEFSIALANSYRYDEAVTESEKALAILEERYGEENLFTFAALETLGRLYSLVGLPDAALEIIDKAERIVLANHGPKHSEMGDVLVNRGWAYLAKQDYERALRTFEHAQLQLNEVTPPAYRAAAQLGYGIAEREHGRYQRAREHIERAIDIYATALDENHPSVFESRAELAITDVRAGDASSAKVTLTELRVEAADRLGGEHALLVKIDIARGMALTALAEFEDAEQVLLGARQQLQARELRGWDASCDHALVELYVAWGSSPHRRTITVPSSAHRLSNTSPTAKCVMIG